LSVARLWVKTRRSRASRTETGISGEASGPLEGRQG
jgi:hypothetical protein